MEYLIPTSKLVEAQNEYAIYRIRRLRRLYYKVLFYLLFNGAYLFIYYLNLENVHFGNFISIYEVPLVWTFCLLVQFALYYADRLPLLKIWQRNLVKRYYDKYNQSTENKYLETISKSNLYK
ncbi:hypothetical protein [Myroides guanonis]|nr:hypothetical protein [Myroides guanonis]